MSALGERSEIGDPTGICDGRIVAVTGAGRGIGRAEALAFAAAGARVVVNNRSADRAYDTVGAIRDLGGEAVAHVGDVSDMAVARDMLACALRHFGGLDVLVNNAGIVRDRMLVNMSAAEWDEAVRVNLRGTFSTLQVCARHWRDRSRRERVDAAVINTTSAAGIYRNMGQANYGAAKAGVASLTVIASDELRRYGVTVNAIAPVAATAMTARFLDGLPERRDGFDPYAAENVAPLVVWLGSMAGRGVTGRIFDLQGGRIAVAEGWRLGPAVDIGRRWDPAELTAVIPRLVARARANAMVDGRVPAAENRIAEEQGGCGQ